ncbi:MAG TPA: M48 family metallopeptidase [Vicinamibacteria bacterium]|nr:M48 family metallopeptidase [Vicinamibacteria bacterium]
MTWTDTGAGLLGLFVALRLAQQIAEHALAALNRRYWTDPRRQAEAGRILRIPEDEMRRAVAYASDRYRFGRIAGWTEVVATLAFIGLGGLGWAEARARALAAPLGGGGVATGLAFFGLLGLLEAVLDLPFALYSTFVVEEEHGFNRQTPGGFLVDRLKGVGLAVALGAPILSAILALMERAGPAWWLWAWGVASAFSLFTAWIYPSLLAPIFNRFTPLPEGALRDAIVALASRIGFHARGIFVMDASRRTAHGNAYFTGLFRQKRIVLFDTLLEAMGPAEVVSVLAHELGHFKLGHVRWGLVRGVLATGVLLYALSLCLPRTGFYAAFALDRTSYGALVAFGAWFSFVGFLLRPLGNALSRRQEFAADRFAIGTGADPRDLGDALLKLRERSRILPLSHPLYSRVYHSHPPLLERLAALGAAGPAP